MTDNDLRDTSVSALSRIELQEMTLLSWGLVEAAFTREEAISILAGGLPAGIDPTAVFADLVERVLLVETADGGIRSRMAETVRLLSLLRQTFPQQQWWQGTPLVLDYRLLHRPRRRPRRDRPRRTVVDGIGGFLTPSGRQVAHDLAPDLLSGFQERSITAVLHALGTNKDSGVMVSAGTGSGKTLGFYLPALSWIIDRRSESLERGVSALALYPRGELLKDQLRAVLLLTRRLAASGSDPIRLATWFGPTPRSANWFARGWVESWSPTRGRGGDGWVCPYVRCLRCNREMIWLRRDIDREIEQLTCADPDCGDIIDGRFLALTRRSAASSPADIMFTTTESLNRQLAAPDQHRAFGLRGRSLRMVLLDEVHTYEGVSGAQNALLARRLRHAVRHPLVWVGLSATLRNAETFLATFTGVYGDRITVVEVTDDELEESGAEYQIALRHDPASGTGPLSTTIQTAMLLTRSLDAPGTPYEPAPTSGGVFGRKTFVFTDKLDVTNRLYWDLLDAEGWWQPRKPRSRPVLTLAHLRADEQLRRAPANQESRTDRDPAGQWWWLPEQLGRDLGGDEQLEIGRTSSQDVGVDRAADVIVATATLEVGYDDPDVGAVIQHKAPHDPARFMQRKGRAGRDPAMRPWTAVVLADWGRDRIAWETYDQLFDPELEPRHLPLSNRYVLRMQAVYSLFDWLGSRHQAVGRDRSVWTDLSAPAEMLESSAERIAARASRQAAIANLLKEVLDGGPAREHLRGHLRRSLGLSDDDTGWREVDALLWTPPRSLLLAVIPTIQRRLASKWAGEEPALESNSVRTRTPLPEYVAGNLFDDLMTPEVEVRVPTGATSDDFTAAALPAMRTLRELMPGNVTRHFGVSSFSRRHWVDPTDEIDVEAIYHARLVSSFESPVLPIGGVDLYRPMSVTLQVPPEATRDASSVQPIWEVHLSPLGSGVRLDLGTGRWSDLVTSVSGYLHAHGGGARVRRFARRASGAIWSGSVPTPYEVSFSRSSNDGAETALGIELDVDGLCLTVDVPTPSGTPTPLERTDRLATLINEDTLLRRALNWFERSALWLGLIVCISEMGSRNAASTIGSAELAAALSSALERLGLTAAADPERADVGGYSVEDGPDPVAPDAEWWIDAEVIARAKAALVAASSEADANWTLWYSRRIAATVGSSVVEALARAIPGLDPSDLAMDLDPQGISAETGRIEVWITELAPGGNGQVEEIYHALAHEPKRFLRLLDRVIEGGDLVRLDSEVRTFLRFEREVDGISQLADRLRTAWPQGHEAVAAAFSDLRSSALGGEGNLGRLAWSIVATRLLGPGASPHLPAYVERLSLLWDEVEARTGFEVPGRAFGAIAARAVDSQGIEALHLPVDSSAERRARAISALVWPRGASAGRAQIEAGDHFGLVPSLDPAALHSVLGPGLKVLVIGNWEPPTQQLVAEALLVEGRIILDFEGTSRSLARRATLALQEDPVDVGALLLHPRVVAMTAGDRIRLEVVLEGTDR